MLFVARDGTITFLNGSHRTDGNVVTNPGMEVDTSGWGANGSGTIARDTSQYFTGSASLKVVTGTGTFDGCYFFNGTAGTFVANQAYGVQARIKRTAGTGDIQIFIYAYDSSNVAIDGGMTAGYLTPTGGWDLFTGVIIAPPNADHFQLFITKGGDASVGTFYVDAVQVAPATRWNYAQEIFDDRDPSLVGQSLFNDAQSFETDTAGWTPAFFSGASGSIARDTTEHLVGVASLKMVVTVAGDSGAQSPNIYIRRPPGTLMFLSAWVKGPNGLRVYWRKLNVTDEHVGDYVTMNGGWVQVAGAYRSSSADQSQPPYFRLMAETAGTYYIDAVTLQAIQGIPYEDLTTDFSEAFLTNEWNVTATNQLVATASDATSIARYFKRSQSITDVPVSTAGVTAGMAAALVGKYKEPFPRVTKLGLTTAVPDVTEAAFRRELGDCIEVRRTPPGGGNRIDQTLFIQKIEVAGTNDRTPWTIDLAVSPL